MKNIERWLEKGYINQELAEILNNDLKQEREKVCKTAMLCVLYTIGALLIGIGVIAFVASNDWILELLTQTPILKVLILLILAVSSLIGGYQIGINKQNFPRLGHALIFLSTILIGTCYIQMGQIYNWSDSISSIILLWFISVFPLAFIFNSSAINWLSIILFVTLFPNFYLELDCDPYEVYTIFMPFTLAGILYTFANFKMISTKFEKFAISYKLTALIPTFFTFLILIFSVEKTYELRNWYYMSFPIVLILINLITFIKNKNLLTRIEAGFISAIMLFVLVLLLCHSVNIAFVMCLAHVFLVFMIFQGFYWGYKFENISLINLNNFFFIIYILSVYSRFGWNYLDKTLFFLLGGAILLTLGIFLEKGKNKFIKAKQGDNE